MAYTVKKLSQISGVSVRTLHWYDEIGLLKPAFIGDNHYRYYEEQQLLRLQQILFFKELGFSLSDIQALLQKEDFDHIEALIAHKKVLEGEIKRKNDLIATIDKTIQHLEGKYIMSNEELYYGFDAERQHEYEQYLVEYKGLEAEKLLKESKKRIAKWDGEEWDRVKQEGDEIYKALATAIEKGLSPESEDVQAIIQRHFEMTERFYDVTAEVYAGLADLYVQHPDFKKFFDVYHPKMIEFVGSAIRFYVAKNL